MYQPLIWQRVIFQERTFLHVTGSAGNTSAHTRRQYLGRAGRWPSAAHVPLHAGWASLDQPGTSPVAPAAPECDQLHRDTEKTERGKVTNTVQKNVVCFYWPMHKNVNSAVSSKEESLLFQCTQTSFTENIAPSFAFWTKSLQSKLWICGCFTASMKTSKVRNLTVMCKCA